MINNKATLKKVERIIERLNTIVNGMQTFQDETGDYTYDRAMAHINMAISELEAACDED